MAHAITNETMVTIGLDLGDRQTAGCVVDEGAVDVGDIAWAAVTALGVTGPADVDVRRDDTGLPVVLEVNARFGAQSAAAPAVLSSVLRAHGMP